MSNLKDNVINCEEINGSGLILIRSEDPISLFLMSLSGHQYSSIGFFFPSSVSGEDKINIISIDILGILNSHWSIPKRLDILIQENKYISKLCIKKLNKKSASFKISIFEHIQYFNKTIPSTKGTSQTNAIFDTNSIDINFSKIEDKKELLVKNLLRKKLDHNYEEPFNDLVNPIELVNKVILDVADSNIPEDVINNPEYARNMKSYLLENNLFQDVKFVFLQKELYDNLSDKHGQEEFFSFISSIFIKMLITDPIFFKKIVRKISTKKRSNNKEIVTDNLTKTLINNLLNSGDNIVNNIIYGLENEVVNYDDFISLVKCYSDDEENVKKTFSIKSISPKKITPKDTDKTIIFKNKKSTKSYIPSIENIRNQLSSISESIIHEEMPIFNINIMIENINDIIEMSSLNVEKIKVIDSETSHQGLFVASKTQLKKISIPINKKSNAFGGGKKEKKEYILPTNGYDLSLYKKDQLVEILYTLDSDHFEDGRFDKLRSDITQVLSEMC